MKSALLDRLNGVIEIADGRDHDDFGRRVVLAEDRQDLEARDAGQRDAEQCDVDFLAREECQGSLTARRPDHAVVAAKRIGHALARGFVLVDHQNGSGPVQRCGGV